VTLGDLSNLILTTLQQPGASFTVGGGGGPSWASLTNPQYSQGLVEFTINQAYIKAIGDLWDQQISLGSFTFTSTTLTYKYAIPPAGYGPIGHVVRVFYQPFGLPYTREFRPGQGLIAWDEFQQTYTGEGYLAPYAFGTQPYVCAINPLRTTIHFYPGSAIAGDTITIDAVFLPGGTQSSPLTGGTQILINATDTPILPVDSHMAIFHYAMHLLWMRARESQESVKSLQLYKDEIANAKFNYARLYNGDVRRLVPFGDYLGLDPFNG
jgi:hypothetical protein